MKRLFRIIISIALLLVSAVGIVFIVWPSYQELSSLRAQAEAWKERLESGQQALAKLREMEEKVFAHAQDFEKADRAVPADAGLPVLYEHIQQLGTSTGLTLISIEGQRSGELTNGIAVLTFQVELSGSYEGLKSFLDEARRSLRILNVQTLGISSDPQGRGALKIVIELTAYEAP